jgi:hypothetical protein
LSGSISAARAISEETSCFFRTASSAPAPPSGIAYVVVENYRDDAGSPLLEIENAWRAMVADEHEQRAGRSIQIGKPEGKLGARRKAVGRVRCAGILRVEFAMGF